MILACRDCKFFKDEGFAIGTCVRYPSTEKKYKDNWCGEFKALEEFKEIDEVAK